MACKNQVSNVFILFSATLYITLKNALINVLFPIQCIKTQKGDLLLPPHLCLNSDLLTSVIYRV